MRRFLDFIDAFLRNNPEVSATRLGVEALNDPRFVFDIRAKGRQPRVDTLAKVMDWMRSYRRRKVRRNKASGR